MKNKILILFILSIIGLTSNPIIAQISGGGMPPSFAYPEVSRQSVKLYSAKAFFDVEKMKMEDAENEAFGTPVKVAEIIPVDLDFENQGEWTTLPDGQQIWRLNITASEAIAITLYYSEFFIPDGGKLFIYNKERTHVIGAYTTETNPQPSSFATEFVAGDNIILEYVAPAGFTIDNTRNTSKENRPLIKISGIGYGYNYLNVSHARSGKLQVGDLGESGSCHVNINCPEGDNWQDEKKGVAKSLTPIGYGIYLCTGTVVNNTLQDLTPYYLTAQHCFYAGGAKTDGEQWNQIIYYFHYESPDCSNPISDPVSSVKTMTGAQLLAEVSLDGGSDGMLLKFNQSIPDNYDVYYNGWDRSNPAAGFTTGGVSIHHPKGDIKKISTFNQAVSTGNLAFEGGAVTASNSHWGATFIETANGFGETEGGSSGGPLFNSDKRVIGTLSGGSTSCSSHNAPSFYGKLWCHWDAENIVDPSTTMESYLDPINSGVEVLDGTYIPHIQGAAFGANKTSIYALESITYTSYSANAETFEWIFEGGTPAISTEEVPPVITYNTPGVYTTTLIVNKGTPEEDIATKTITVTLKGGTPVAAVARFSLGEKDIDIENFDMSEATDFPPTGWTVDVEPGMDNVQWEAYNRSASSYNINHDFNTVDPANVFSAMIPFKGRNSTGYTIDTWLKTPIYIIPDYAFFEFYAGYEGSGIGTTNIYFYISIDDGVTWTELWNNKPAPGENIYTIPWEWRLKTFDLSVYAGQEICFAWQFSGQDYMVTVSGIDGVRIYSKDPATKLNLNVGDYISPTNLSEGPPVFYEWTFDGATSVTSDQEDPGQIRYMTPGVYDVSLWVKNTEGEDTYTVHDAVTVTDVVPKASIGTNLPYNRQADNGPFIPPGTVVDFIDRSVGFPASWEWTFEGGMPAASTEQNPTGVKFNNKGVYNLELGVSNTAGSDSFSGSIKVGGRDTIWNLENNEEKAIYTFSSGHRTGTNNIIPAFAEKFEAPMGEGAITAVKLNMVVTNASSTHKLPVSIAASNVYGLPGEILGTATLWLTDVNQTDISDNRPTVVEFVEPVAINGPYFVIVGDPKRKEGDFMQYGPTAVIVSSAKREIGGKNTLYNFNGLVGWISSADATNADLFVSLDIAPVLTYVEHEGSDAEEKYVFNNIDRKSTTINVTTNLPWRATSSASWINIIGGENNDGEGSFIFTVNDNKYDARRAFIRISAGDGYVENILVVQAGPAPEDLAAIITNEDNGEVELAWNEPTVRQPYKMGDDIFEDVEGHTPFTLDSREVYGWTYIDGDGGTPTKIVYYSTDDYPNSAIPSSFIVYNPYAVTPPITDAMFAAHSGKQFFACPFNWEEGKANDDWIVSPELGFASSFTFSFWAKTFYSSYGQDRIKVAYSTTGNNKADFTNFVNLGGMYGLNVATEWTKYEYTIPADAKYVAINCISNRTYMLMLDDIFIGTGTAPGNISANIPYTTTGKIAPAAVGPAATKSNVITEAEKQAWLELTGETYEAMQTRLAKQQQVPKFEAKASNQQIKDESANEMPSRVTPPTIGLRYDDTTNVDIIGLNSPLDEELEVAIRFTPLDLLAYHGDKITSVEVFVDNIPIDGITLKITQGNEVYTQKVTALMPGNFTRIPITGDLRINASKETYVGYEYIQRNHMFVAGISNVPARIGTGDLISTEGYPLESIYEISDGAINGNWNIALFIEDNGQESKVEYNIYRDRELITTVSETEMGDILMSQNTACYEVAALYFGEAESTLSNAACINLKNLLHIVAEDHIRYINNPNPDFTMTITGNFMNGDAESDIQALLTLNCAATINSQAGDYPIEISRIIHDKYRFTYKDGTLTVLPATDIENVSSNEAQIYPTVTSGIIHVVIPGENKTVEVFDLSGKILYSEVLSSEAETINITSYEKGIYFVKVGKSVCKIIKQ